MSKHARLADPDADGRREALEVVDFDPAERFHPEIAALFTPVAASVVVGSVLKGKSWTHPKPEAVEAAAAPRRVKLSPPEYLLQYTAEERVAIRKAAKESEHPAQAFLADWLEIINDPRLTTIDVSLPQTRAGHDALVATGFLSAERKAEIEAGVPA